MGPMIVIIAVLIILAGAVVAFVFDPSSRAKELYRENNKLKLKLLDQKKILAEKDKEIEALKLGLPWYNVGE